MDTGIHSLHNQDIEVAYKETIYSCTDTGMGPKSAAVHIHAFVDTHIHMYQGLVYEGKGMVSGDRDTCKVIDQNTVLVRIECTCNTHKSPTVLVE